MVDGSDPRSLTGSGFDLRRRCQKKFDHQMRGLNVQMSHVQSSVSHLKGSRSIFSEYSKEPVFQMTKEVSDQVARY